MQKQRAFLMEGSFSCGWNWWEACTYSGDISSALPGKDKTPHKPLFCPALPSSHPKPTSLGWGHLTPQKFLPWQCHEGLVSIYMWVQFGMSNLQDSFDWAIDERKAEENLAGQAWGIQTVWTVELKGMCRGWVYKQNTSLESSSKDKTHIFRLLEIREKLQRTFIPILNY